jgi:hypothetical protein
MQAPELATLNAQLMWLSLCIGIGFGAIAQRTHFCTMGAVSDVVNMGDWTRMRQWGLAVGLAMVGFGVLVYTGRVDPAQVLYASNRWIWLSALVGGGLFGLGMVLASGCGSKTLVRIGGGSLKSLVVLLVLGASAFWNQFGAMGRRGLGLVTCLDSAAAGPWHRRQPNAVGYGRTRVSHTGQSACGGGHGWTGGRHVVGVWSSWPSH